MNLVFGRAFAIAATLMSLSTACESGDKDGEAQSVKIQGAGASFPAPLYTSWIQDFRKQHPGARIDYQSVGSGNGVKSVIDGMVDFGASDAAMTEDERARVERGVQLLPMTAGSIVLVYNLPGVDQVKLSRDAYTGIFLGKVTRWNDPSIVAANPGATLPDEPIKLVVRADSSGTTFVFTKHLAAVSEEFAKAPGAHKMPAWTVGTRAKGNEGVTASIKTTPGSLGYVEYGYAESQKLHTALLENASGKFVKATKASGQAALAAKPLPEDMVMWTSDPEAADAYPIVTYTWLILYKRYADPLMLKTLRDFVEFSVTTGQERSEKLGYIPLPDSVRQRVKDALTKLELAPAS